jgi:alkylation response protein AidB-like acyl-CoA dehydrogenase
MELLAQEGLTRPESLLPDRRRGGMGRLLRVLACVGQGDASVGRLLEGHANALELLASVAPAPLRERALEQARRGALYGVWGADPPENPLRAEFDDGRYRLSGAKLFCSGADGLDAALVLATAGKTSGSCSSSRWTTGWRSIGPPGVPWECAHRAAIGWCSTA